MFIVENLNIHFMKTLYERLKLYHKLFKNSLKKLDNHQYWK